MFSLLALVLTFVAACTAAAGWISRRRSALPTPEPHPVEAAREKTAEPTHDRPSQPRIEIVSAPGHSCAVNGCRGAGSVRVPLSSRSHLHLCSEHALALEFQRVRWGIRDPRAALKGLSRVEIGRA